MTDKEMFLLLGEIKGKLNMVIDNQNSQGIKFDSFGKRLNKVEQKAAFNGLVSGSIAAVGVSIIRQKLGV